MATAAAEMSPGDKINFPNMLGSKRRRMRSGGGVSTATNNTPKAQQQKELTPTEEKTAQTSKCKGANTIPIFLKKTYKMIDTCDPKVASWTPDGEMFVVKDPDVFAATIIPQYFDHNKFSSFARQLNFYGFRKMQAKPIRNMDYDADTAKHVTFYNEKFKRGRCDLLKEIQRSTRGGGSVTSMQEHQREVDALKQKVSSLEHTIEMMNQQMEERMSRLELDMLGRFEQLMIAMQQQQQQQMGGGAPRRDSMLSIDLSAFGGPGGRLSSIASLASVTPPVVSADSAPPPQQQQQKPAAQQQQHPGMPTPATLPPHPKQKQMPPPNMQGLAMNLPGSRLNSLRGISRGVSRNMSSGLSRNMSVESSASAVLMRNSWEDKFFSTLMLGDANNEGAAGGGNNAATQPLSDAAVEAALAQAAGIDGTNDLVEADATEGLVRNTSDLSSVSTSDMP